MTVFRTSILMLTAMLTVIALMLAGSSGAQQANATESQGEGLLGAGDSPIRYTNTVTVKGCTGSRVTLNANEKTMLVKHNRVRADRGLKRLCIHPKLQRAVEAHTQDMIRRDYFDHGDVGKRLKKFGYNWRFCGENIAYGSGTRGAPGRIFDGWMSSSGHRSNILNRKYREVGIGAVTGNYNGTKNTTVWTVDFGVRGGR